MDINEIRKYNPEGSNLRKAQHRMLEMLIAFDKLCQENKLDYWLDGGTLLGAVRHGGFIPWDDDTDVGMTRKSAEKLKEILKNKKLEDRFVLQHVDNEKFYINTSWFTLRDIYSEYNQDTVSHNKLRYRGLQVDVFIYDKGLLPFFKKVTTLWKKELVGRLINSHKVTCLGWLGYINFKILHYVISPVLRTVRFNNRYDLAYGIQFTNPISSEVLFPLSKIEFEGHTFSAPHAPSSYLRSVYGNWERIPEADEIKIHASSVTFFDNDKCV